jgi:ElaB/YqjD/DUF883 family membrane-anchored ribosome-binding protein
MNALQQLEEDFNALQDELDVFVRSHGDEQQIEAHELIKHESDLLLDLAKHVTGIEGTSLVDQLLDINQSRRCAIFRRPVH